MTTFGRNQRILSIVHGLTVGGAEVDLVNKCSWLAQHYGYDITVCCLMRRGKLAQRAEDAGIQLVGPLMEDRYDVTAVTVLRQLLLSEPWSLVHTHIFAANLVGGIVWATLRPKQRPPLVVSEHAMAERWGWLVPCYYRWLQGQAAAILVPSRSAVDSYVARGLREQNIQVMPNALEVDAFERATSPDAATQVRESLKIPQEAYLVGTVCRLERVKGVSLLISAIQDLPVHLVIAGDGPEHDKLSALVDELDVRERVRLLGTRSDVPDLLTAFDLFVLPSYSESFGIVVAEALLSKTPVVATKTGGIAEVTDEGQYAYLVSPGKKTELAHAITWMMRHPAEAREQAARGRLFVRNTFSLDTVAEKQHMMYRRFIRA